MSFVNFILNHSLNKFSIDLRITFQNYEPALKYKQDYKYMYY